LKEVTLKTLILLITFLAIISSGCSDNKQDVNELDSEHTEIDEDFTDHESNDNEDNEETTDENEDIELTKWMTEKVDAPKVEYRVFHSDSVNEKASFHIYIPDSYKENPEKSFPVLYYLHGSSGTGLEGVALISSMFDQAILKGTIPDMLIVFPYGLPYGMWVDSKDGTQPMESILMDDLIPYVDENYRTKKADGRIVEGFSMGGYGAGRLGLKYHNRFNALSMLGAGPLQLDFLEGGPYVPIEKREQLFEEVYGSDMDYFEEQSPWRTAESVAELLPENFKIRIVIGTKDTMYDNNLLFKDLLDQLGIAHQYHELPDVAHTPLPVVNYVVNNDPEFYLSAFGADIP
jgi:S-formylglutathione hydrolase FrmB